MSQSHIVETPRGRVDMGRVNAVTQLTATSCARRIQETANDEEADVRLFLASVELLSGTDLEQHRGRAVIEWYADRLVRPQVEGYPQIEYPEPTLSLEDAADVLSFLSCVKAISADECFGHGGDAPACGFDNILRWVEGELRRHARSGKGGAT